MPEVSLSYNDRLSIDRANSTYEYLISKGISKDRITSVEGLVNEDLPTVVMEAIHVKNRLTN